MGDLGTKAKLKYLLVLYLHIKNTTILGLIFKLPKSSPRIKTNFSEFHVIVSVNPVFVI